MSAPPRPVARAVSLASPFSPRRGRGAAARPLSTAALLDSADEGDDEEVDNAAAASCGPAEPTDDTPDRPVTPEAAAAAAPPVKRSKGRIRRKNSKSAQQGPKFSDSGGGAAAASKGTVDNGELVLSANAILDSLARLREQSDAKACAVTASDNVTTSTPSATSTSSPAAEDGPRADDDDKQEAESWSFRRRKGGAEGEASSRSYHRDCQEALQSLLWEPYDCRDPKDTPMYQYADDADVSLWLYPRPGLGGAKLSTRGGGEGCRCPCRCALHHSPSDSSSDCSSMSDTSPSSPTPVPLRETSASSLRGLLTASTSGGSSAADGWTAPRVTPGHQHHHHHHHHHSARRQRHQASPRLVTDLKTPWIGTPATQPPRAASSLRGAPPAALGSPRASLSPPAAATAAAAAAAAVASVAPPPRSRQSETGRAGRRTLTPASPGSACSASYGHRRPGPNMLVNVSVPQDVSPCVVQVPSSGVSSVTVSGVVTSAVSSASSATSVCVPSPSVSAVPTIPCLNNVSNVHIHASSPTPRPRPRAAAAVTPASPRVPPPPPPASSGPRTYASTEAQTDDLEAEGRRERRRERRERRHLRRLQPRHPHPHPHGAPPQTAVLGPGLGAVPGEPVQVPDLLHSHLPPPYSTLPLGLPPHILAAPVASMPLGGPPPLVAAPHGAPPPQHPQLSPPPQPPPGHHRFAAPGLRLPFAFVPASRRRPGRGAAYSAEEEPKSCCGVLVGQPVSIRWFILLILLVGLCCAVVGTVLGAMKASGREHLTVSLLMIGVGIVLVTVSGVAWRLTSHDAPSCRVMLGMASGDEGAAEPNRRFVPRLPPSYGRPHHPYAAMMYPEFQYRPPPPSYQASMQEYRLRLLLLDRHPGAGGVGGPAPPSSAVSPPPTYRSHAGSLLRAPLGCRREVAASEYSRPPSYRSRSSSTRPSLEPGGGGSGGLAGSLAGALAGALGAAGLHSRTGSVATEHSLSDAGTCPPQPVSVISVGGGDSVKCDPDSVQEVFAITGGDPASSTLQMMLRKSDRGSPTKDTNLVTIVQTSSSGAVTAPAAHPRTAQERPAPVIVTVSGATTTSLPVCSDNTEMEILAHL